MSATIQAVGVGAGFGDRELFSGVDLVVAPGNPLRGMPVERRGVVPA